MNAFWTSAAKQGTPLIEEIPSRHDEALYTFLWRAESLDPNFAVRFAAAFTTRSRGGMDRLNRLANTDVWYGSYALSKRASIGYAFILPVTANPSVHVEFTLERDGVRYGLYRDPLNTKTTEAVGAVLSLAEGPSAKSSPYLIESDVPRGKLQTIEVDSAILKAKRRVDVYTPPGYSPSGSHYPFVLLYDGDEYTKSIPTPRILDNMIAGGAIPPVVVGFFHSPDRDRDLLPGDEFQAFVSQELLPTLRQAFHVSEDPRKNVVAGFSLGGLAAVYTATTHPKIFGNVICQSGSLWWGPEFFRAPDFVPGQYLNSASGGLIKTYAEAPKLPIRFHLEAGIWEDAGALLPSRLLASVLKGKSYEVSYSEFLGGHDSHSWKQTLPEALIYVLK